MNYHYCLKNVEHGYEDGCRYMRLVLYKDGALESIERVYELEPDSFFEFCQDIQYGQRCAFDVLADYMGEDAAAYRIDEYCFEPCWEYPGKLFIIDGESYTDALNLCKQLYNKKINKVPCTERIDLRLPSIPESLLWDAEGIKRFEKCFGEGS